MQQAKLQNPSLNIYYSLLVWISPCICYRLHSKIIILRTLKKQKQKQKFGATGTLLH